MKKILSKSLDDTSRIAREWMISLEKKEAKNKGSALVVGLSGNLGSGKTAFVKAVALALGIRESVTSPTFVIEKIYNIFSGDPTSVRGAGSWGQLVHIDAYRIESARELEVLNFEELVEDPNNLILIEWPENVREILPEGTLMIRCEFVSEEEREYGFE
jgi:tRNA threonylcarbamoyladenosine biosynthesis protein TsaE